MQDKESKRVKNNVRIIKENTSIIIIILGE